MVDLKDLFSLLHPVFALIFVYPIIGMVVNRALLVRQRRLTVKSNIPPVVGKEHVQLGRTLAGSVVALALLGTSHEVFHKIIDRQTWVKEPFRVTFLVMILLATIASLTLLYQAKPKLWRGVFATLTGMGLILLGSQPEVFHRNNEWYLSHYYYGIVAAMLMIFSLAIIQDIYQDKSNRWRNTHIILNSIALLFFIGQGFTGTRDLLEIPLSWQEPFVYKCDFVKKICP